MNMDRPGTTIDSSQTRNDKRPLPLDRKNGQGEMGTRNRREGLGRAGPAGPVNGAWPRGWETSGITNAPVRRIGYQVSNEVCVTEKI